MYANVNIKTYERTFQVISCGNNLIYRWYPGSSEVVVPWSAQYSFPSQANKAIKLTPRIPPKNGATFTPGQVIRVEFPAQGYVNPLNTT
jgi:hypothetical protein